MIIILNALTYVYTALGTVIQNHVKQETLENIKSFNILLVTFMEAGRL